MIPGETRDLLAELVRRQESRCASCGRLFALAPGDPAFLRHLDAGGADAVCYQCRPASDAT